MSPRASSLSTVDVAFTLDRLALFFATRSSQVDTSPDVHTALKTTALGGRARTASALLGDARFVPYAQTVSSDRSAAVQAGVACQHLTTA